MFGDSEAAGVPGQPAQGSVFGNGAVDEFNVVIVAAMNVNHISARHPMRRILVNG